MSATNPALRAAVLGVVVVAAAALGYAAARHGMAEHWAASTDPDKWLRAAQMEPSNAEGWYRLGRYRQLDFEHADLPLAIAYYKRAAEIDPYSATYWMDLASAYEMAGNVGEAESAFRTAQRVYPISGEVAWRFGNFLLRQNEVDESFEQIHHAVMVDPKLTALAVSRCWRSTQDIGRILDTIIPAQPDAYWGALEFLVGAREPDASMQVWKRLMNDHPTIQLSQTFPLIEMLIEQSHADGAKAVWQQAVAAAGVSSDVTSKDSLIWNGGFEQEDLLSGGLAWRYQPQAGVTVGLDEETAHSGKRSLRLDFDGTTNIDLQAVWQYAIVQPDTHYRFSAYFRTQELTTDMGVHFEINDWDNHSSVAGFRLTPQQRTPNIVGTQAWVLDEVDFTTAPDTHVLRIILRRRQSDKLGNKIRGTAWVDDIRLVPISASVSPTK